MQSKQSSFGTWLAVAVAVGLAAFTGGVLLFDKSAGGKFDPVDFLMQFERFYREDLAVKYTEADALDPGLRHRAWEISRYYYNHREDFLSSIEDMEEGVRLGFISEDTVDFITLAERHIREIVVYTYDLFRTANQIENILNGNRWLVNQMDQYDPDLFKNIGELLFTPLNQLKLSTLYNKADEVASEVGEFIGVRLTLLFPNIRDWRWKTAEDLMNLIHSMQMDVFHMFNNAVKLDETCTEFLKKKCTWVLHDIGGGISQADLSLPLFFNDVAALIHRVAEVLQTRTPSTLYKRIGHIDIRTSGAYVDQDLIEAVTTWASTVTRLERAGWRYYEHDVNALYASVVDSYAWMRVGSSAGHATHIGKSNGQYKINYYDEDAEVNKMLAMFISKYVPGASVAIEPGGVEVTVNNLNDLIKVAKLLAFATSLDLLIESNGANVIEKRIVATIEKLKLLS